MTEPTDDAERREPGYSPPPAAGAPGAGYSRPGYSGPPGHGRPPYGPPGYGPPGYPAPGYPPPGYAPPGYPPPGYGPPGYGPPPGYGYPPAPPLGRSPSGQPLASFGERLLAWLLDVAITTVATFVLVAPAFVILIMTNPPTDEPTDGFPAAWFFGAVGVQAWTFVASFGITYVYFVELMWRRGQTVGKRVMNLRVIPLNPWESLSRGTAAKRWLIQNVATALVGLLGIIDGLWQLWDKPFQQTLHDKFAQTVVVKISA